MHQDSSEPAHLLRAANRGDAAAYRRLLEILAPRLRAFVRRGLARARRPESDCEDIVQEALLAIHLKRSTWDETQALMPWVHAIAHYKLVDALRRRGFRDHVPLDQYEEREGQLESVADASLSTEVKDLLSRLPQRQRDIVIGMAVEGRSAREIGSKLGMADGAVRVSLHRALKALADLARGGHG